MSFTQIETDLCEIGSRDSARVMCLLARVMQQLYLWTQTLQANVDYGCVWRGAETRRVHSARPQTKAFEPALTDASLAAKRRAEALHAFFLFKQESIRAQHDD